MVPQRLRIKKRLSMFVGRMLGYSRIIWEQWDLCYRGFHQKKKFPKFENLTIKHKKEKLVERSGQPNLTLKNCLEIQLEPFCDSNLLVRILDTLSNEEPSGRYDSPLLLDVVNRVLELVKRPPNPPSKQEVVGAWGELKLLHSFIKSAGSNKLQSRFINGWEASPTNRSIIDFMFPFLNSGVALEAKTSCIGRTHHFHGLPQVTIPDDYNHGWIASLVIAEDNTTGQTCSDLVSSIKRHLLEQRMKLLAMLEILL